MAIIEGTWIFGGPQHGWQERLYWQQSDPSLTVATQLADSVATRRANLLGREFYVKGTRVKLVSQDNTTFGNFGSRLSRVRRDGYPSKSGAQIDVTLLLSFYNNGSTLRKSLFLGGIWDDIEVDGGQFVRSDPQWQSFYNTWVDFIKTQLGTTVAFADGVAAAGWLHGSKSIPYSVTNYLADENQFITMTLAGAPFTGMEGRRMSVRFSKMDGLTKSVLNGLQAVQVLSANTCKLLRPIAAKPFPGVVGQMVMYTFGLVQAPTINPEAIRTRERGRPLLVSAGRAPNRART